MSNYELPLSKSPEAILEARQERRPRQLAMDIMRDYPPHERIAQVDRLVPPHLRAHVREYIIDWTRQEKQRRV